LPVCIAGMHRSGTSLVSRLLYHCGLYLGPEAELLPPRPGNEEGYWENRRFVELNQTILFRLGYGWDLPPDPATGWENRPEIVELRGEAQQLVAQFANRDPWGWKDPRNSLTLPFWQSLIPDLTVVVCIREPLEVARSLSGRGDSSEAFGLDLWLKYNLALLGSTQRERRILTHYNSYFRTPETELSNLVMKLSLPADEAAVKRACTAVSRRLRHNLAPLSEASPSSLRAEVDRVYRKLCDEAGLAGDDAAEPPTVTNCRDVEEADPVTDTSRYSDADPSLPDSGDAQSTDIHNLWRHCTYLSHQLNELRQHTTNLETANYNLRKQIAELVAEREATVEASRAQADDLQQDIVNLRQHSKNLEHEREATVNAYRAQADELQQSVVSLRQHSENLEHELQNLRAHSENLNDAIRHLRQWNADLVARQAQIE
jgi:hypothetical protein